MIGKTVASGRYELVAVLGEGAQGTTFEAIDRAQSKRVAIKRFSVRGAKSWKDVELAEREASVLSSLSHPNLPKYLAHFEEDGALYLVMDKIEGRSVAELMQKGVVLERADVMRFLSDAARVLGYLRDRAPPVIHRDINPKNVIRRPDGSFVVVDFGAVRDRLKFREARWSVPSATWRPSSSRACAPRVGCLCGRCHGARDVVPYRAREPAAPRACDRRRGRPGRAS
jgi:serine/threonine protein kinase